ncbi:hypothetical protein PJL18_04071 [Paenarthrobacter nicotinovorans]|nr:hypothetical protein [Paenarthrobacter nicotinovorans]
MLVQYAMADALFPEQGMHDAHARLSRQLPRGLYTGSFWQEPHVFTPAMQEEAAAFLATSLQPRHRINSPLPDRTRTDS